MYLKVLIPLKLDWVPSYFSEAPVPEGTRVRVHFARKEYIGVVLGPDEAPSVAEDRILPLDGLADGLPDITSEELKFWKFLASYYMCNLGEVYKAVYPQSRTDSEFIGARKAARKGTNPASVGKSAQRSLPSRPEVLISQDRTDAYISEIERTVSEGRDALVLVPEFKLAAGMQKKLKKKFGDRLCCYNSRMTVVQRRNVCEALRTGEESLIILGTRSALFLPFSSLGLIIVDEEQDSGHKNGEPAPRFNARDAATVLAGIHDARILLGTSCPSFETILNLQNEKFQIIYDSRGQVHPSAESASPTPPLRFACGPPTSVPWAARPLKGAPAPDCPTTTLIDITAEKKKHGMRGDISFKLEDEIRKAEGKIALIRGWEKEDELRQQLNESFPETKIEILKPSETLTATAHYSLMAVLQADALFDKTDFRSDERTLQTLCRLAGKADRLVIQTARASHPVFSILKGGTDAAPLLEERKDYNLPPYTRVVDTVLTDLNPGRLKKFAAILSNAQPEAVRLENEGCIRFRTTLPRSSEATKRKEQMMQIIRYIEKEYSYSGHIHFDVDPT